LFDALVACYISTCFTVCYFRSILILILFVIVLLMDTNTLCKVRLEKSSKYSNSSRGWHNRTRIINDPRMPWNEV